MPTYHAPGVYIEEFDSGPVPMSGGATAVPAFIGFTEKLPTENDKDGAPKDFKPRLVTSWTQYRSYYGGYARGDWEKGHRPMLPVAVAGYFDNGGKKAYIVPIEWETFSGDPEKDQANLSIAALVPPPLTDEQIAELEEAGETPPEPTPQPVDDEGNPQPALKVRTDNREDTISISIEPNDEEPEDDTKFGIRVRRNGAEVLNIPGLRAGEAGQAVRNAVKDAKDLSDEFLIVEDGAGNPTRDHYVLQLPEPVPADVTDADIKGRTIEQTGINGLQVFEDVTMIVVPDLYNVARFESIKRARRMVDEADEAVKEQAAQDLADINADWREVHLPTWKAVQTAMITHCEQQTNCMAILDPPPNKARADLMKSWRMHSAMYDSQKSALYFPWLQIADPIGEDNMFVPPSGHMAGVWARTDATRGVWKAPANEVVQGIVGVQYKMTSAEQEELNPNGINAIRPFPGRGVRVWGAKTLSSNKLWEYIPVRRLFSYVEKTIEDNTHWVVFEPNDQVTWDRVTRTVSNFLTGLWRDGALFGASPAEAFYVKCDAETNPQDSIDRGQLICEVGIAPVKPAEFVIFRVTQKQVTS
ncbi:MAG: phage tail sheath subtilisin-like domain-containing protein [Actinomycetota bacterium]